MENLRVNFVLSNSMNSVLKGAAFDPSGNMPHCPVSVGDVISDPAVPGLFVRVTKRLLRIGQGSEPGQWFVTCVQAEDPFAELD